MGMDEEPLRIQARLSPLEPNIRHRDVGNHLLGGVGDWVLHRNELAVECGSKDGIRVPTLLCYGSKGAGKTFIRYYSIPQKLKTC